MIWLQLLGIGRYILNAAKAVFRWALSDWKHAVILLLVAATAFYWHSAGKWQGRAMRALETVEKRDKTIADMRGASEAARMAQIALNEARKKLDADIARKSDDAYDTAKIAASDAATRYITRWRVRPESCTAGAATATEGANTAIPESLSSGAVLVSEGDVQACTGSTAYAIAAHNHAIALIEAGVAE